MSRSRKETRRSQERRAKDLPLWVTVSLVVSLGSAAVTLAYLAVTGVGSDEHPGIPVRTAALVAEQLVTTGSALPEGGEIGVAMK